MSGVIVMDVHSFGGCGCGSLAIGTDEAVDGEREHGRGSGCREQSRLQSRRGRIADQSGDLGQCGVVLVRDEREDLEAGAGTQTVGDGGRLRGQNRDAIFRVRDTKQSTAEARQEIDRLHLQLQNLYYEQKHLTGEIAACEAYEYVNPISYLSQSHFPWRRADIFTVVTNTYPSL
jgi:hypothetical protein